jgi:hypothetical protein
MRKSINPMCCSFRTQGEAISGSAPGLIVLMSLQPAIPWRVALLHCPPPLHRLDSVYHPPAESVNHHPARAGEFSTGTMGNFQPELTSIARRGAVEKVAAGGCASGGVGEAAAGDG